MLSRSFAFSLLSLALTLSGCDSRSTPPADGGMTTPTPDGGMTTPTPDSGTMMPRPDAGPPDRCAASQADALSTLGCNGGFASGEPAANETLGGCTPGDEANPAGSCTSANTFCAAPEEATEGLCQTACPPASTYITSGGCPSGFRCFTLSADFALCFRDCNAANPCPSGFECDEEGSCVQPAPDPGKE